MEERVKEVRGEKKGVVIHTDRDTLMMLSGCRRSRLNTLPLVRVFAVLDGRSITVKWQIWKERQLPAVATNLKKAFCVCQRSSLSL